MTTASNQDDFDFDQTCNFDPQNDDTEDTTIKELNKLYQHGTSFVRANSDEINKEVLLYLYARFKYITEGSCNIVRPSGMLNFEAKAKWDAWYAVSKTPGMNKEIAREQYIAKLDEIDGTKQQWRNGFKSDEKSPKGRFDEAIKKGTFGVRISIHEKDSVVGDSGNLEEIAKNVFDLCKDGFIDELKSYFRKVDKNTYERMLNQRDDETNKMTLLMWACDLGHLEIVKFLVEAGANVNAQDAEGQTCLHYAVSCENLDVCKYLCQVKALNRSLRDNENARPIDLTKKKEFISLLSS